MTTCARRAPERRVDPWGVVVCVCVCRREGGAVCLLDEAADGEAGGVELERRGRASADIALWLRRLEPHAEQQLVLLRAAEVAVAHAVAARVDARLAEVSSRRLHAAQHLEGLEDDEAGDDGVGGGDGVDDPPRDPLDLPPRLERDVEGCAAQVGGGSHKVHRVIVILAQGRGRSRAWAAGGLRKESGEGRVESGEWRGRGRGRGGCLVEGERANLRRALGEDPLDGGEKHGGALLHRPRPLLLSRRRRRVGQRQLRELDLDGRPPLLPQNLPEVMPEV